MKRKKIDVNELAIGMYVSELDRPWLETSFIFQGFPITTQEEITTLQHYCKYIYIDTEQSRAPAAVASATTTLSSRSHQFETRQLNYSQPSATTRLEQVSFESELKQAATVYRKSKEYINAVFADARLGRSIDPSEAR